MTTSLAAYEQLLQKVNREDSNSNIHIPKGKFVTIFNEQQRRWLNERLDTDLSSDELDNISDLLVDDAPLEKLQTKRDHVSFKLPEDFFYFSTSYSLASKGQCTGRVIVNWNTKSKNLSVLLTNENHAPSFEYEETLLSIASGKVKVFFTDFQIDQTYLSYYRFARNIDLDGYIKIDGSASSSIDPELDSFSVDQIINRCAAEIMRNNDNTQGLQIAQERLQKE